MGAIDTLRTVLRFIGFRDRDTGGVLPEWPLASSHQRSVPSYGPLGLCVWERKPDCRGRTRRRGGAGCPSLAASGMVSNLAVAKVRGESLGPPPACRGAKSAA